MCLQRTPYRKDRKGLLRREAHLMKERRGVEKVPRHSLYCWAAAVKAS